MSESPANCSFRMLLKKCNSPEEYAELFSQEISPEVILSHLALHDSAEIQSCVECSLKIIKEALKASLTGDGLYSILTALSSLCNKVIPSLNFSLSKYAIETFSEILSGLLHNYFLKEFKNSQLHTELGILFQLEETLVALAMNAQLQKKLALEISRLWIETIRIGSASRAAHIIEALWERMGELVQEKSCKYKKRSCVGFMVDPSIQVMSDYHSTNIQLCNFLIFRSLQAGIFEQCHSKIAALLPCELAEARQEITDSAKLICQVVGKLLQCALNECTSVSSISDRQFLCFSFVEDLLRSLLDPSLPICAWILRVVILTVIKLLEAEKKNRQFRSFLADILIYCYTSLASDHFKIAFLM